MKILVTGGAGYLGSVLVRQLLAEQQAVTVLDSLMYGAAPLENLEHHGAYTLVAGDLRDRDLVFRALQGIDAVVHLAAIVGDPACSSQPDLARSVNLDGSLQLIRAAAKAGIKRFVFASTCSNYGRIPDQCTAVDEEFQLKPLSLYAETKVAIERELLGCRFESGLVPTVLRFATLYGPSPRMRFDLTVNEFTQRLFFDRRLVVYGEQFWRPYVHVRDAARAISVVLASSTDVVGDQVFNVGDTKENYRKADLIEIISSRLGLAEIQYVKQVEDPRDYRVSCDRISKHLGFAITRRVPDGVDEIIQALENGMKPSTCAYNVELIEQATALKRPLTSEAECTQ